MTHTQLQGSQAHHIQGVVNSMNLSISCTRLAGRIAHFSQNWEVLIQDQWVLQTVGGYQLDLLRTPHQYQVPNMIKYTRENSSLVTLEVTELLSKGAIVHGDPTDPTQFCLPDIPGGEEGWWAEASYQPERPQPVCEGRTFQDKGPSSPPRSPTIRGLDGEDGSKRCIPPSAYQSLPSTSPIFPVGGEVLYVHVPTLQPLCSTKGIHQTTKTSSKPPLPGGMPSDNIPGRSTDFHLWLNIGGIHAFR